jgi:integrase
VAHLSKTFRGHRAKNISSEGIHNYITQRQTEGVSTATINRELAALKRMYRLGLQQTPPLVTAVPHIPRLREHNVRTGFVTEEEYAVLKAALPDHVKVPFILAYWTGMRAGEIVWLRWEQVDVEAGTLRLEPGTTKNGRGRVIPLVQEVIQVLRRWKDRCSFFYPLCPWVCHYRGKRMARIPRRSWFTVCNRVGLEKKSFHDLRRTAVRNMVRAGISERVAMAISGHQTRSIFDRYNIVSQNDLLAAKLRLEASTDVDDVLAST